MSKLTKYHWSLMASAECECQTPKGKARITGISHRLNGIDVDIEVYTDRYERFFHNLVTPILREHMTEEEIEAFIDRFLVSKGHQPDHVRKFKTYPTNGDLSKIIWLLEKGINPWPELFESGLIRRAV